MSLLRTGNDDMRAQVSQRLLTWTGYVVKMEDNRSRVHLLLFIIIFASSIYLSCSFDNDGERSFRGVDPARSVCDADPA